MELLSPDRAIFNFYSSLFDGAEERYKKLAQTISQITISQLGEFTHF